jgi:hypothetical protein
MAPESMVVEDGVEQTTPGPRGTPPWLLVVVAFGFGLALGTFVAPAPEASTTTESEFESTPTSLPAPDQEETGIGSVVEGFPNGIVAVGARPGDGSLSHLTWPLDDPLVVGGITGGSDVRLDATGQFVALSTPVPGVPGLVLSSGRPNSVHPVLVGVISYAWHDSRSGELAFTTGEDDGWQLFRASRTLRPQLIAEGQGDRGSIVGWGDWGFAVQTTKDQVALFNADGDFKDVERGTGLASHHSGWVLAVDEDLKLVSSGGGVRRLRPVDEVLLPVAAASFSPDASRVALAGPFGIVVLDVTEGELTDLSPAFPADWVSWSSDGRFVIAPAFHGAMIHDLSTGDSHNVLQGFSILDVASLPDAAS